MSLFQCSKCGKDSHTGLMPPFGSDAWLNKRDDLCLSCDPVTKDWARNEPKDTTRGE